MQLLLELVEFDFHGGLLVKKNINASHDWSANEILEFLSLYEMRTSNDVKNPNKWIDFSKELAKKKVYHNNKQCKQKVNFTLIQFPE